MKNEIVFALYKDEPLCSVKTFKEKIKKYINDIDVTETYKRIFNYQIEKYGCVLERFSDFKTIEEFKINNRRGAQSRYKRRSRRKEY